jgi:6-phosphogluconate dehydrogenase
VSASTNSHINLSALGGQWNFTDCAIEITRDILACKDTDGSPLVEKILDTGRKGTRTLYGATPR